MMKMLDFKALLTGREHRNARIAAFGITAAFVLVATGAGLRFYGKALQAGEVLDCQFEIHSHSESCYSDGELVCGYADYVIHIHDDRCYDADGNLACPLEEHEAHEHDESCYETRRVLVCDLEESAAPGDDDASASNASDVRDVEPVLTCQETEHTHDEDCYSDGGCSCDMEEHSHDDGCMSSELTCQEPEHTHDDGCYDEDGALVCQESEHEHDDGCYSDVLSCGIPEHTHDDSCMGGRELMCDVPEHSHGDGCYEIPDTDEDSGDGSVSGGDAVSGHVHDDSCYEETEVFACGELELHEHGDGCFDSDGNWICGTPELLEHVHGDDCFRTGADIEAPVHEHDTSCFDDDGNVICGFEDAEMHEHTDACYGDDGELICGYVLVSDLEDAEDAHEHDARCYDMFGRLKCGHAGYLDHVHSDSCYDPEGKLICGYDVRDDFAYAGTLGASNAEFDMAVSYGEDAGIPDGAKLDAGLYKMRDADRDSLLGAIGDENAVAGGTLKFSIYVLDDEGKRVDVAPEGSLHVTLKFKSADGLLDGSECHVLPLGGGDLIAASDVEAETVLFDTERTGRFAIGFVLADGSHGVTDEGGILHIKLADTFDAESGGFRFKIRIDGDAKASATPEKKDDVEGGTDDSISKGDLGASDEDDGSDPAEGAVTMSEARDSEYVDVDDGDVAGLDEVSGGAAGE